MGAEFSSEELVRYSRHLILPDVGPEGQRRLKQAKVLLVGAGGLGSPAALYLAAAGVGTLGIIDGDVVDLTNLQRQVIHGTEDIGRPKTISAKEAIHRVNPHVHVETYPEMLSSSNAMQVFDSFDFVIDGTDNFPTRYLVNDACVLTGKINVYGSVFRFDGQASVFCVPDQPCYRCLYPEPPPAGTVPNCAEGGVLGVLPGIIGLIQATEAIKLIVGIGEPLIGRLALFDALSMTLQEVKIQRDPQCPICGDEPTISTLVDYDSFCGIQARPAGASIQHETSPAELLDLIRDGRPLTLLDVREPFEYEEDRIPGSILVPLGDLPSRISEFSKSPNIVVHCKSGSRSSDACALLEKEGLHASNLTGGILAWMAIDGPTDH